MPYLCHMVHYLIIYCTWWELVFIFLPYLVPWPLNMLIALLAVILNGLGILCHPQLSIWYHIYPFSNISLHYFLSFMMSRHLEQIILKTETWCYFYLFFIHIRITKTENFIFKKWSPLFDIKAHWYWLWKVPENTGYSSCL